MNNKNEVFLKICGWCGFSLLLVGALARLYLYMNYRDLWLDEAMLAKSFWAGDMNTILSGKLLNNQMAPVGFLVVTKLVSYFFGTSELVLRFFPLVSGVAAGFLLWMFAKREFDEAYAFICIICFITCRPFMYYATEFKQYATEYLVTIVYICVYCASLGSFSRNIIPFSTAVISCFCLLFSLPALFVFWGMAASILVMAWKRGDFICFIKNNLYKILLMLIFVGLYSFYLWELYRTHPGMFTYWGKYFFPLNIGEFPAYFKDPLSSILSLSFNVLGNNYANSTILACSFFGGLYFLYKKNFPLFLIIFMTGAFYLSASAMKLYPLGHGGIIGSRLSLFYFSFIFIAVSYFFYTLCGCIRGRLWNKLKWGVVILLVILTLRSNVRFAIKSEGMWQQTAGLIKTINAMYNDQSEIVIYGPTVHAYTYYQHRNKKEFIYSVLDRDKDPAAELNSVIAAGKERNKHTYYVLFSHVYERYYDSCVEYIKNNYALEQIIEAPGARLVIFQISLTDDSIQKEADNA